MPEVLPLQAALAGVRVEADAFGRPVRCWPVITRRGKAEYLSHLEWLGGPVGWGVPVTVAYGAAKAKDTARGLAHALQSAGYTAVTIEHRPGRRAKPKSEGSDA